MADARNLWIYKTEVTYQTIITIMDQTKVLEIWGDIPQVYTTSVYHKCIPLCIKVCPVDICVNLSMWALYFGQNCFWARSQDSCQKRLVTSSHLHGISGQTLDGFLLNFVFGIVARIRPYIPILVEIWQKLHLIWRPMYIHDVLPWLMFIIETDCVLCEVWNEEEETVNDLNISHCLQDKYKK